MAKKQLLLSIGIIFKDNIRSIERCLKALQPLRDAVDCELIMADTGSTDGSREIAERYADILFDFEWVNDFAAARNAVMDKASGRWYFSVDTDEYLDAGIPQLVEFLQTAVSGRGKRLPDACTIKIRNYNNYELTGAYSDFTATRILRMSTGLRFVGAIHERWEYTSDTGKLLRVYMLSDVTLLHDGYVDMASKAVRNIPLIREKLKANDQDLLTWLQFIESGGSEPDLWDIITQAMEKINEKIKGWESVGPPIYSNAITCAFIQKWPEIDDWISQAEKLFPDSPYVGIDIQYLAAIHCWNANRYEDCARHGRRYLKMLALYREKKTDQTAEMFSTIKMQAPYWERYTRILLASSYVETDRLKEILPVLKPVAYEETDEPQAEAVSRMLMSLHMYKDFDTAPLLEAVWKGFIKPEPSPEIAEKRKGILLKPAALAFTRDYWEKEPEHEQFCRHGCMLYLPLAGQCWAGDAAALMDECSPEEASRILFKYKDSLASLPPMALLRALERGVEPPVMTLEEADVFAACLTQEKKALAALGASFAQRDIREVRELNWMRAVVLAAVRACDWKTEGINRRALAEAFIRIERVFLPLCYTADLLTEDGCFLLPPVHRFGWYCTRAWDALENGDATGCVRLLRASLDTGKSMKGMIEYLMEEVQKRRGLIHSASPELMDLAEHVRQILARYPAGDPAVGELKKSAAYQKVAWLIENPPTLDAGAFEQ